MKLKNSLTVSLIVPLVLAIFFGIKNYQNDPSSFWEEYPIVLLILLVFWLVTSFIGILLSQIIKKNRFELFASILPQIIIAFCFIYYSYFMKQPMVMDKNENMKSNRLMVDYEERLDDSIAKFPNFIRIAYRKLESEFSNPNEFKLTFFGSEKGDSLTHKRTVYFSYKIHDSLDSYSIIQVFNDTAKILTFNKNINDTTYLNAKKRLETWGIKSMIELSKEIKKANSEK